MKNTSLILAAMLLASCTAPISPKETLTGRLESAVKGGAIFYGHQDDLVYGHAWKVEDCANDPLERSDVKDVTGKYPAMAGFDLGGIETGDRANLDSVDFGLMRRAALKHIERGGMVTFSWHPRNPLTGGDAWDISSDRVVRAVLPGGECEEKFGLWLSRLGDFLESLGTETPVIFRPWHENVGSWFWWGGKLCTAEDYRELYRQTWRYLVQERGLDNIVWCYSPNGNCSPEEYIERYPGDEYVDIMGVDTYEYVGGDSLEGAGVRYRNELRGAFGGLKTMAKEHGKLMCLSETGLEGIPDPHWWTETLYPVLCEFPVAYVLTWRNAHDKPGHFYAAWKGFENEADMKAFSEHDNILFLD